MKRKKPGFFQKPEFIVKIETLVLEFLDWIAPVVDWVGDQAEKYKAASDAVPPPSKKWVHKRRINTGKATVTVFLFFLTVMTILALYLPNRPTYSEMEHRNLTTFPKATAARVLNGQFFDDINIWFADTFPMREKFLGAQNKLESFYGFRSHSIVGDVGKADDIPDVQTPDTQPAEAEPVDPADTSAPVEETGDTSSSASQAAESTAPSEAQEKEPAASDDSGDEVMETLGAVLVIKDSAYEYYNFVQQIADDYAAMISRAAERLKGKANVYDMVVPTSMDICVSEKNRKKINTSDQAAAIQYIYSKMSGQVNTIDLMETLSSRQEEGDYLYFRTDHHWTALGAYYAYTDFAKAAGKEAAPLSDYEEHVFEGFTGSFYRETESSALAANPDTIYAYGPKSTNTIEITLPDGGQLTHDIISNGDTISATQKYLTFIGGDNPFSVIENPDITDGSAIMVIKDSFGNCFAPYLVENYQYVYVVDYRYIAGVDNRDLVELVEDYQVDDVLFIDNISDTREQMLIDQMTPFIG